MNFHFQANRIQTFWRISNVWVLGIAQDQSEVQVKGKRQLFTYLNSIFFLPCLNRLVKASMIRFLKFCLMVLSGWVFCIDFMGDLDCFALRWVFLLKIHLFLHPHLKSCTSFCWFLLSVRQGGLFLNLRE